MQRINNRSTLYYQLTDLIIKKIVDGEWKAGDKVPSERELCEMYNISRITVRQAFFELEKHGYIYRKQGKGTFVTVPKFNQMLGNFYSFSEEIKSMGQVPSTKVISFEVRDPDSDISLMLELGKDEKVMALNRVRYADGKPLALEWSYLPFNMFHNISIDNIVHLGLYNTFRQQYHISPDEALETFEAINITKKEAEYLDLQTNSAAFRLKRATRANGLLVEYCISILSGEKYRYEVLLKSGVEPLSRRFPP